MKQKEMSIETLRGIAIILMVAGHVIGHNQTTGMRVENDSFFRYFYFSLQYLRMPLFTVISGYVYSLRPFTTSTNLMSFLQGKARRLLLPMIFVGTIQFLFKAFMPDLNRTEHLSEIWRIYFFGFEQFWFLQSIFLIFLTIVLIEYLGLLKRFELWLTVLIVTAFMRIFFPTFSLNIFSMNGYFLILPFFILGCGIERFSLILFKKAYLIVYTFIFVICFTTQQIQWFVPFIKNTFLLNSLAFLVAFSGITLLFKFRFKQFWLSRIGFYAFSIFLFHVFGTAGSRFQMTTFFPEANQTLIFLTGLIFGIVIPIIFELILNKSQMTRLLFLGISMHKKEPVSSYNAKMVNLKPTQERLKKKMKNRV